MPGAYRTDIDQEIHAQSVDGPVSTRTSVTFDFSEDWRVKDSPWAPPSGMSLNDAVSLLIRGICPLSVLETPIVANLRSSRSPSLSSSETDGEFRSSSEASLSRNPVEQSPCDDDICEVCLSKCVIASLDDCDCVAVSYYRSSSSLHCRSS